MLTACDPGSAGRRSDDGTRMSLLAAELAGLATFPAEGSDPAGQHAEASLAVAGLTDGQARALGARFGQVAVFAWRGAVWSVLACVVGRRSEFSWTTVDVNSLDIPLVGPER